MKQQAASTSGTRVWATDCCAAFLHQPAARQGGHPSRPRRRRQRLAAGAVLGPNDFQLASPGMLELPGAIAWQLAQLVLVGAAAYVAAAWHLRPRGWCRKDLVRVGDSPVQGLGVFATASIPQGTVLGTYPGRPRSPAQMEAKAAAAPPAAGYCFQTDRGGGWVLDPTDAAGQPSMLPAPGLPWLPVDPSLSRVNEPPPGHPQGPNLAVEDDPSDDIGIILVASRDIEAGEELLLDYGLMYDRTAYSSSSSSSSAGR